MNNLTLKSVQEIELYTFFHLYDRMFLSESKHQFSENVEFFFQFCLTEQRREHIKHKDTFDSIAEQLVKHIDSMDHSLRQMNAGVSILNILFRYLTDVLISLKQRLQSEAMTQTEGEQSFILRNMPFLTLELYYVNESTKHSLNQEGTLFQQARFICCIDRLTLYIEKLVECYKIRAEQQGHNSFETYVSLILKHLSNLTKSVLYKLSPYKNQIKEESLFMISFDQMIRSAIKEKSEQNISHLFNEYTYKEMDKMRQRIQDFNFAFFRSMINQVDPKQEQTLNQIKKIQENLSQYFQSQRAMQQESAPILVIQKQKVGLEIQLSDQQDQKQKTPTKTDVLKSKKLQLSQNKTFLSPFTGQQKNSPIIFQNEHEVELSDEEESGRQKQFTLSKEQDSEQSQVRDLSQNPLIKRGSLEAKDRDRLRKDRHHQHTSKTITPIFKEYLYEVHLETEQDMNLSTKSR